MNLMIILGFAVVFIILYLNRHKTTYIIQKSQRRPQKKKRQKMIPSDHRVQPPPREPSRYRKSLGGVYAYDRDSGPYPGKSLNVPVPRGSLKITNESYGFPFYKQYRPLQPRDYFRPYGPNQQNDVVVSDTPSYARQSLTTQQGLPSGYSPPYTGSGAVPFYGSVNSYAPFPEINTAWEKAGLLSTVNSNNNAILNLYRRAVAPLQDLFQYSVQDKNGFIILLRGVSFLEDGDTIPSIIGKESLGPWKANIFIENKFIWV